MSLYRSRVVRLALAATIVATGAVSGFNHTVSAGSPASCSAGTQNELQYCGSVRVTWLTNPGGAGSFDPTGKHLFTQALTTINYPDQSGVFTDFQTNGRQVPAQKEGVTIGSGNTFPFEATFTGALHLPNSGGDVTFIVAADDGWFLGFAPSGANQPSYVSGPTFNLPPTTATKGYPVQVGFNGDESANATPITIHFPTGGGYLFELDMAENTLPPYAIQFADASGNAIDNN